MTTKVNEATKSADLLDAANGLALVRVTIGAMLLSTFFENLRKGLYTTEEYAKLINSYIEKTHAPDVWKAIESHEVKPGMNELQASFALGVGVPEGSGSSNPRVVNYPNDGHPVKVTFENGRATDVKVDG